MKRIIAILIALLTVIGLSSCSGNSADKSPESGRSKEEKRLYEAIRKMSNDFFEPSEIRLLEIGDYKLYYSGDLSGMGDGCYYGITVRLQGENKVGGTLSQYYTLRLDTVTVGGARLDAEKEFDEDKYYKKNWDECKSDKYPRSSYGSFEEYREETIKYKLENYYFTDYESAMAAAEKKFDDRYDYYKKKWDECSSNKYPRDSYDTFAEYRDHMITYDFKQFHYPYTEPFDAEIVTEPDDRFLYCECKSGTTIENSMEDTYRVSYINKALKAYWDDRLGN